MRDKKKWPHIITAVSFVVFIVLGFACASSPDNSETRSTGSTTAAPVIIEGIPRVTESALAGEWKSDDGIIFIFSRDRFKSNALNSGKTGVFNISASSQTYLITFYSDKNIEGQEMFGTTFYFENPRTRLVTMEIQLSEDGREVTLTWDNRVILLKK